VGLALLGRHHPDLWAGAAAPRREQQQRALRRPRRRLRDRAVGRERMRTEAIRVHEPQLLVASVGHDERDARIGDAALAGDLLYAVVAEAVEQPPPVRDRALVVLR